MASITQFKVPTFTDKQLSDPAFSRARIVEVAELVKQRDGFVAERDKQIVQLSADVSKLHAQTDVLTKNLAERDTAMTAAKQQIAQLLSARDTLQRQLDKITATRPKIAVGDLVQHFRGTIETINSEAIKTGLPSLLVENLQVEIKGGIDVSDGIRITQLPESAIGVDSVSTLRFNLKPNAIVRMVDDV